MKPMFIATLIKCSKPHIPAGGRAGGGGVGVVVGADKMPGSGVEVVGVGTVRQESVGGVLDVGGMAIDSTATLYRIRGES
jgi:hypothetical protein